MQPMIGPISVPRPPTITQMMICADCARPKIVGLTNVPQLANRQPAKPASAAADREGSQLVGARIVSEEFGAPLVLPDADDNPAEAAGQQHPQAEIAHQQRRGRKIEHALQIDRPVLEAGQIERRNARNAVEAAEPRGADMEFWPRGGIDRVEQDQRHGQRDDAEIDVADPAIEHEIAEQRGESGGNRDRQQQRNRAFADIDHRDRVGIGTQTEERGLAEAQDAAITPDQAEAQRQDRHDHVDGEFQQGVQLDEPRGQDQERDADDRRPVRGRADRGRGRSNAPPEEAAGDALRQQADQHDRCGKQARPRRTLASSGRSRSG